jgi:hypothetical protein
MSHAPLQLSSRYIGIMVLRMLCPKCQYVTNDIKVAVGMKEMSLVEAQNIL